MRHLGQRSVALVGSWWDKVLRESRTCSQPHTRGAHGVLGTRWLGWLLVLPKSKPIGTAEIEANRCCEIEANRYWSVAISARVLRGRAEPPGTIVANAADAGVSVLCSLVDYPLCSATNEPVFSDRSNFKPDGLSGQALQDCSRDHHRCHGRARRPRHRNIVVVAAAAAIRETRVAARRALRVRISCESVLRASALRRRHLWRTSDDAGPLA